MSKQSHSAWLILGNQQFLLSEFPQKPTHVYMSEDWDLCTFTKHHKQKLLLYLTSMRTYAENLKKTKVKVQYTQLDNLHKNTKFEKGLSDWLNEQGFSEINIFEVEDHFFEESLIKAAKKYNFKIHWHQSPMFLNSRESFENYLGQVKSPFMAKFYQQTREELGILIDKNGKPEGGKWSFDSENRKKLPKGHEVVSSKTFTDTKHSKAVKDLILKNFADHPGELNQQWLPFERRQALQVLDHFLSEKIDNFGDYQDAIEPDEPFMYHSLLSVALNLGWLTPQEVVNKTLEAKKKRKLPINSVEGFLRQVIGWREFVRGIYHNFDERMQSDNFFGHKRTMKECWYEGTTGLPPVDDCIKRARAYGYNHHIERLMVLSNVMLLSQINPHEVYKWFMEMYVDSSDWVMAANVYGMGQFSEGGIFATKPYISGSNYIRKQSHYPKGDWCDVWDGLYWQFISKHKTFFSKNPRLSMMARMLDKMSADKKQRIFSAADAFIKKTTQ